MPVRRRPRGRGPGHAVPATLRPAPAASRVHRCGRGGGRQWVTATRVPRPPARRTGRIARRRATRPCRRAAVVPAASCAASCRHPCMPSVKRRLARQRVFVHIAPRPRQRFRAASGLAAHDLEDRHVVVLECIRAAGKIHAPDAEFFVVDEGFRLVGLRLEVFRPDVERARIVPAQAFDVNRFEPAALRRFEREADVRQLAVREHVAVDEFAAAERRLAAFRVGRRDPVVHRDAVVGEQVMDAREVERQVLAADVLEHPDARDAVELAFDLAVILQTNLDPVFQPRGLYTRGRQVELVLRQRHAETRRAELLRGAQHERTPAAADVEQALAGLELDLRQDVVDLLDLRGGEILVAVLEVRTRVHHVLVEPQLVERVRDVVVVLDRLLVGALRMIEVAFHARELARARHGAAGERVADVDDVRQLAFDVDLALHVRLAEIVEARFEQQRQRRRAVYLQRDLRCAEGAEIELLAVPQHEARRYVRFRPYFVRPLCQLLFPEHLDSPFVR